MVKFTFGMIVLNGEPFLRYNLNHLYPHAHEIIVVEGAAPAAASFCRKDGHSNDGTLELLIEYKKNNDPENKLTIITAEDEGYPDGFWPGEKNEQSRAYAKRATGNYLWQVDSDEFYKAEDIEKIRSILENDFDITAISFPMVTFWGSLEVICDSWYLRRGASTYHRLFKWGPGYKYETHRPPTVLDDLGRNTRKLSWLNGKELKKYNINLYHYSLLFPRQVYEKCAYYADAKWSKRVNAIDWYNDHFIGLKDPFRLHNIYEYPGWLEKWQLGQPVEIENMWNDIKQGIISENIRDMDDVNSLLRNYNYQLLVWLYKIMDYFNRFFKFLRELIHLRLSKIKNFIKRIIKK